MDAPESDPYFAPRGTIVAGPTLPSADGMLARVSLIALGLELLTGFGLGFNLGWANDWPFGLSPDQVIGAVMTTILFAIQVTLAIGLGALIRLLLSRPSKSRRYAGAVFEVWLLACISLAVLNCSWFYRSMSASE
jgi:hypothetical protein